MEEEVGKKAGEGGRRRWPGAVDAKGRGRSWMSLSSFPCLALPHARCLPCSARAVLARPQGEKAAAQRLSGPFLDALDKAYNEPCEGTGFYALQSCLNHSCCPSATAEGESSGCASILALQEISVGEEVAISYIDEEMGLRERREALRDYGFKCSCAKCTTSKGARKTKKAA